jgi:hypothetical protein
LPGRCGIGLTLIGAQPICNQLAANCPGDRRHFAGRRNFSSVVALLRRGPRLA